MSDEKSTSRCWFVDLASGETRLRCSFHRLGKRIVRFAVQLEIWSERGSVGKGVGTNTVRLDSCYEELTSWSLRLFRWAVNSSSVAQPLKYKQNIS